MQNNRFIENLEALKKQTEKTLSNISILDNDIKEDFLRNLEKIRYDIFESIEMENKYSQKPDIDFINKHYEVKEANEMLRIMIPEVLPKYKNVSNPAYKNILTNVSRTVVDYKDMFNEKLTFVLIIVHERQKNMDIDNKYVKPIIDALVEAKIVKDDNITNVFYQVMGKSDTIKPYTEVYVMDGKYLKDWIESVQDAF